MALAGAVRDSEPESDGDDDSEAEADDVRDPAGVTLGGGDSVSGREPWSDLVAALLAAAVFDAELDGQAVADDGGDSDALGQGETRALTDGLCEISADPLPLPETVTVRDAVGDSVSRMDLLGVALAYVDCTVDGDAGKDIDTVGVDEPPRDAE